MLTSVASQMNWETTNSSLWMALFSVLVKGCCIKLSRLIVCCKDMKEKFPNENGQFYFVVVPPV